MVAIFIWHEGNGYSCQVNCIVDTVIYTGVATKNTEWDTSLLYCVTDPSGIRTSALTSWASVTIGQSILDFSFLCTYSACILHILANSFVHTLHIHTVCTV